MMSDLFSSLDGASNLKQWLVPLVTLLLVFNSSFYPQVMVKATSLMVTQTWNQPSNSRYQSFNLAITILFVYLALNNLLGLTPYSYTLTSNLFTVMIFSLIFWGCLVISGWILNPTASAAHLAPSGAPLGLQPILVLIETISILIRPLTLTVRLIANISAGHIVLGLMANTLSSIVGSATMLFLVIISIGYTLFEFFVAFIQAYIFTLLITLYQVEHP
uniref:ATP synthase subunit a n=1 Tax=Praticolella mexicana TaxID=882625 RepID=A0A1J0MRN5_9EUPU|nr:ATP synthase F0 subunit 6 [Praticolella mexicana]APD28033.1 ATP synthase F0 subunit 6 [Praticolella mexicana]